MLNHNHSAVMSIARDNFVEVTSIRNVLSRPLEALITRVEKSVAEGFHRFSKSIVQNQLHVARSANIKRERCNIVGWIWRNGDRTNSIGWKIIVGNTIGCIDRKYF